MHLSVDTIPIGVSGTKSVYLVKTSSEPVPHCDTPAAARIHMPLFLDWGVLNGHSLQLLERVISLLYLPLLSGVSEDSATDAARGEDGSREEFLVGLRKFAGHLRRTIQQVEGDVKLRMPALPPAVLENVEKCVADVEIMKQVSPFDTSIADMSSSKEPSHHGPARLLPSSSRCCGRCLQARGHSPRSSVGLSARRL